MRKIITYIFLVAMIFTLCFSANATEYSDPLDSRIIPQEVLELADPGETDILFRYYRTAIVFAFSKSNTIEEVFSSKYTRSVPFYALETETDRTLIYLKDNGTYTVIEPTDRDGDWPSPTFQEHKTGEAIRTVSSDIVIESMYYINGENDMSGTAIYYKTNLGDYVFFNHWSIGERLFSAETFFEYQRAAYAESTQNGDKLGTDFYSGWDLSAYDYRSDNFDPHAPFPKSAEPEQAPSSYLWVGITAGAVVLAAIAAFFIIKAKRKASPLPEEA